MIVTVAIAVVSVAAAPMLGTVKIAANENVAIATMERIAAAQKELMAAGIDTDRNGRFEYGYLQELAGVHDLRVDSDGDGITDATGPQRIARVLLSSSCDDVDESGVLRRSGYCFRVYLPAADLSWIREPGPDQVSGNVSGFEASRHWACYAWPASYGSTGLRAFFVQETRVVLACANQETRCEGSVNDPDPRAAIVPGGDGNMGDEVAINAVGRDGNLWSVVERARPCTGAGAAA